MHKKSFSTELSYLMGIVCLALGVSCMEAADFGVSMVVAPAYLLYLKLSPSLPFFSFGMAEYTLQAALLVIMCLLLRRFRVSYLFSFVTAVVYGFILDGFMALVGLMPHDALVMRFVLYLFGMLSCSLGVAFVFHTYVPPEAYELFVKELSARFHIPSHRFKTAYDLTSCLVSVALSFLFFGLWHFEGIKLGTVLCALVNGSLIGWISRCLEKRYEFRDSLKLRAFFETK